MDFSRTSISLRRPLGSYSRVQAFVSRLLRGRRFQLKGMADAGYLNLGCGPNLRRGFVNVDYQWRPGVLCWDMTRGLPFPEASQQGIFSEHCLEHLPLAQGYELLREIHRVLKPGGRVRIVVPDAQLYLETYLGSRTGSPFPYQDADGFRGLYTPMMSVNRIFYVQREERYGHNFMYDFETLATLLKDVGFREVGRARFGEGADPALLLDAEGRRVESLYVEAQR